MWLWLALSLQSVLYSQAEFGTPYLKSSRLCQSWACINTKLGLAPSLPPRYQYENLLKTILNEPWYEAVDTALDICYEKRTRNYVNTCPGQALLQCTLDNLIQHCPESSFRRNDGCYPISSVAGTKYMFTQSRYKDLEKNLPKEKRPAWFMKNYFSAKCCDVPNLINTTVLNECGFTSFLSYHDHVPKTENFMEQTVYMKQAATQTHKPNLRLLNDPNSINVPEKTPIDDGDKLRIVPLQPPKQMDPLQCCDLEHFIKQSWTTKCGFDLTWAGHKRLQIGESYTTTTPPPATTVVPVIKDIKVVPLSCEKETCVFRKLNVISDSGSVNMESFTKLLDNFTAVHPTWSRAKARVITTCFNNITLAGYEADCHINRVLACTLDVMSENCPFTTKQDVCRHSKQNTTLCQISSSKYRPRNRRPICGVPKLVSDAALAECGLKTLTRTEYVTEQRKVLVPRWTYKHSCQDSTPSTLCLMSQMGVLNKYNFMDYFKMKDRIRQLAGTGPDWGGLVDVYLNAFASTPLYSEHCNSARKLLNVIDAMLMTCPLSKRKNTAQCNKLFYDIANAPPIGDNQNVTKEKLDQILKHFNHVYLPTPHLTTKKPMLRKSVVFKKNPIYDYGLLNHGNIPQVKVISIKPTTYSPLEIFPVYMRKRDDLLNTGNTLGPYKNGIFKSNQYLLHGKLTAANPTENLTPTKPTSVSDATTTRNNKTLIESTTYAGPVVNK